VTLELFGLAVVVAERGEGAVLATHREQPPLQGVEHEGCGGR
jgi:hypothetical protein